MEIDDKDMAAFGVTLPNSIKWPRAAHRDRAIHLIEERIYTRLNHTQFRAEVDKLIADIKLHTRLRLPYLLLSISLALVVMVYFFIVASYGWNKFGAPYFGLGQTTPLQVFAIVLAIKFAMGGVFSTKKWEELGKDDWTKAFKVRPWLDRIRANTGARFANIVVIGIINLIFWLL